MSHKSGTVIVRMAASHDNDPIKTAEVELDVTGKTPEEVAAMTRQVVRKIESMSSDED